LEILNIEETKIKPQTNSLHCLFV